VCGFHGGVVIRIGSIPARYVARAAFINGSPTTGDGADTASTAHPLDDPVSGTSSSGEGD
jgi:hypothetical protein